VPDQPGGDRPTHRLLHISDTHLLGGGRWLCDAVDCEEHLRRLVAQVERSEFRPDAVVVTGDVADLGEAEAYVLAREVLDPLLARLGCPVLWVMGNHDHRTRFREHLLDPRPVSARAEAPNNHAVDVDGLRLVALDSAVPGYHHGVLAAETLAWLADLLTQPAERGTVLALHHPPLPTTSEYLGFLDLRDRERLADVVRDTDVRAILAGHWHMAASGAIAGIPVLVAGAISYALSRGGPDDAFEGIDDGQSYSLVELFGDHVAASVVPLSDAVPVAAIPKSEVHTARALDQVGRDERVSRFAPTDLGHDSPQPG
jgi:3',5'-cyclic AMP phosphodiesterase CpdA